MTEPHTECAICNVAFKDHGSVQHGFLHPAPPVDDSLRQPISEAGFKSVLTDPRNTIGKVADAEEAGEQESVSFAERIGRLENIVGSLVDLVRGKKPVPTEDAELTPPQVSTDNEPVSEILDTEK